MNKTSIGSTLALQISNNSIMSDNNKIIQLNSTSQIIVTRWLVDVKQGSCSKDLTQNGLGLARETCFSVQFGNDWMTII